MTQAPADQTRVMPLDVEHAGIRFALPVLAVVGFLASFITTNILLSAIPSNLPVGCIALVTGAIGAVAVAILGDFSLKRMWPSRRTVVIDSEGLRFRDQRGSNPKEIRFAWDHRINTLAWRFAVKRGSARVPKGWLMLSIQMLQDEGVLTLYSFLSAQEAEALSAYSRFTPLLSRSIDTSQMALKLQAEQRRLLKAEDERWHDGAEVRHDDFLALLDIIAQHLPEWKPQYRNDGGYQ